MVTSTLLQLMAVRATFLCGCFLDFIMPLKNNFKSLHSHIMASIGWNLTKICLMKDSSQKKTLLGKRIL